jgi:hypothetical protein
MELLTILLLTIALIALALAGLGITILIKRGGRFPNTHVGGNKYLRNQGIACAQTQDRQEQAQLKKKIDYTQVKIGSFASPTSGDG